MIMLGGLGKKQGKTNKEYYVSKGQDIYSDFITYAASDKLAYCTAKEFYPVLAEKGRATVFEFGIGNGLFAKKFLLQVHELCKKDGKEKLFSEVEYVLHDISPKMIESAKKNLSEFGKIVDFLEYDATSDAIIGSAGYIKINELLSDLPAEVFVGDAEGNVLKVKYGEKGTEIGRERVIGEEGEIAKAVTRHFPPGYFVPINFEAGDFLLKAADSLEPAGHMDIFDYGFANAEDLLPADMWNPSVVREYGGQLTVDLNFPYLLGVAKSRGYNASVEPQKEYAEKGIGQKLYSAETKTGLEYYTESELGKAGITEERLESSEEDDAFYHMRVKRA